GTLPGLDVDPFDAYCEHLLVRTRSDGDRPPRVVGTYRLLTPLGAQRAGGLYADAEFSLNRLDHLRPRMAEVGRACVDPAWRGGAAMLLLWSALAQFMHHNGLTHMIGCASVPMHDGGHAAASLWAGLRRSHLAEPALAVQPRLPLPLQALRSNLPVAPPPLLAGYLRCGARLLGPPAWDPDFGTADLPLMLRLDDLPPAYRRRFDLPA
ncbi:MAG: GNAT family N-acetyltransferase, partial [Aquabacterium sp.]